GPVRGNRRPRLYRLQEKGRHRSGRARRSGEDHHRCQGQGRADVVRAGARFVPLRPGLRVAAADQRGEGPPITDQIKALRRQLATEMGFVMPAVRILDNMQLSANEYRIRIKEVDSGRGDLYPGSLLVMD